MNASRRPNPPHDSTTARCVAIVQARLGSSRLPGKMLLDLGGHPILQWALARARLAREVDTVVLATTTAEDDDALAQLAAHLGIACSRGDEPDVLGRLVATARAHEAETIVRICADNPLIAPEEINRLVRFYRNALTAWGSADRLYAQNAIPEDDNGYPDGLGAEIFSMSMLAQLDQSTPSPSEREHVTSRFREDADRYDAVTFPAPREIAGEDIKLDIDTSDDLERMRRLCAKLDLDSSAATIVKTYRAMFAEGRS